jgi:hypothetical protein
MKRMILAAALCLASLVHAATITDVRVSGAGPVTFGQVFAAGDVKKSDVLVGSLGGVAVPLQVDTKATYADGSVRHAIISAEVPKAGTMQINTGGVPGIAGTVSSDAVIPASVSSTIGGVKYSATSSTAGKATWLQGPVVNEWQTVAPLTTAAGVAHPHLTARFAIRYYTASKKTRVDVTVENAWAYEPGPQNFTYDADVSIDGKSMYSKTALTHFHHARWRKVFWDGPVVQLNTKYLIASKAVPNYDQAPGVAESLLARLDKNNAGAFEPMALGMASGYMPTTGANEGIGLLPMWSAAYVLSQDPRARDSTLGTGNTAGSYSMHYRDRETDRPVSLLKYPYMTIVGRSTDTMNPATRKYEAFPGCGGDCATPYTHDTAHQPSLAYLPYLVTGDVYYLEELQFWAMYNAFSSNPGYRQAAKGLFQSDQVRGQAWSMRTLAQAAAFTPDADPLKADFLSILNSNVDWYRNAYVAGAEKAYANKLGIIINGYAFSYNDGNGLAPWQDDFFTSAIGYMVDLGFTQAKPLLDWKAQFPVKRMTDAGSCWIDGGVYSLVVRSKSDAPIFDNFAQAQQATRGADFMKLPCGGPEMASVVGAQVGDMGGLSNYVMGYPSNMQPALAYAVDSGIANSKRAWDLFMSRTVKPDYSLGPHFSIIPRAYSAAFVAPIVDTTPKQTWVQIAKEGETVTVPAGTTVRYGADSRWITKIASGAVTANNDTFGKDPAFNTAKVLQKLVIDTPVVTPPVVTPPVVIPTKPGKVTTPSNTKLKSLKGLTLTFFGPAEFAKAKVFTDVTASTKGVLTVTDSGLIPGTVYGVIVIDSGGQVLDIIFPVTAK